MNAQEKKAGKWVIEVWDIFHMIQMDRDVMIRKMKEKIDLSLPLVRLLLQIDEMSDASQTEIADVLGLDVGNLSRMCRYLEDRGLIIRTRSERDRRALKVRLSDDGQKIADDITRSAHYLLSPLLEAMTEEEVMTMCEGMHRFISMVDKIKENMANEA